jgi:starch-binding outer membrane protein, SusD/RagB family
MHINRDKLFGRRIWLAIAAGALFVSACNTDQLLKATDPDNTPPGALSGPSSLPGYRASAISDFGRAFDGNALNPDGNEYEGLVNMAGLLTDELQNSETFPTRTEVDRRHTQVDNATMRDIFFNAHLARVSAERASGAYAAFGPSDPGRSEVESLQAYAILLLAEDFCSGVPLSNVDTATAVVENGTPMTTQALLGVAADTFTAALTFAAADPDRRYLAEVGKARTLQSEGRSHLADASLLVQDVPTNWTYKIEHSKNSQHQWNGIYEFMWLEGRWIEADTEGVNGLRYRDDPRNPASDVGSTFVGNTQVQFFGTLRYSQPDSSTVVASGIEARLIEAEAALQANNNALFLKKLNDLRDSSGIAGLAPLADPGTATARQNLLFSERGQWLYLTDHRLGDLRRLSRATASDGYGRDPESVFPTGSWYRGGVYGSDTNFPIPIEELNNPNVQGPAPNTCIDRNP